MRNSLKTILIILCITSNSFSQESDSTLLKYFSNPVNIKLSFCNSLSSEHPLCLGCMDVFCSSPQIIPKDSMAKYIANQSSRFKPGGSPIYVCLENIEDSLFIKTSCPLAINKGMDPTADWSENWGYRFNNSLPDGNYFVWNNLGRLLEHRVIRNNKQNGLMFHSYIANEINATINLYEDGRIVKTGQIFNGQINDKRIGVDSLNSFEKEVYEYYLTLLDLHYFEYAKSEVCNPVIYNNHFSAKSSNFNDYIQDFCQREFGYKQGVSKGFGEVIIQFKIHQSSHPKKGQFYDYKVIKGDSEMAIRTCIEPLKNYSSGNIACPDKEDIIVKTVFMVPKQ